MTSPLTCLLIQMTVRTQERLISGLPPRNELHFFCHRECLVWVPGPFQGRQRCDALPRVLPRRKAEISKDDKAKHYCLNFCSLETDFKKKAKL